MFLSHRHSHVFQLTCVFYRYLRRYHKAWKYIQLTQCAFYTNVFPCLSNIPSSSFTSCDTGINYVNEMEWSTEYIPFPASVGWKEYIRNLSGNVSPQPITEAWGRTTSTERLVDPLVHVYCCYIMRIILLHTLQSWEERSEDQNVLIERILVLLRNILHVPATDVDKLVGCYGWFSCV